MPSESSHPVLGIDQLSDRELEVFSLIGQGLTTHEISEHLELAISTVETYRERLKIKLDIGSGAALMRHAVIWSITHGVAAKSDLKA